MEDAVDEVHAARCRIMPQLWRMGRRSRPAMLRWA